MISEFFTRLKITKNLFVKQLLNKENDAKKQWTYDRHKLRNIKHQGIKYLDLLLSEINSFMQKLKRVLQKPHPP